jgi:hypothetical protein
VRHRWFDDWRGARGPALKALVADVLAMVAAHEQEAGARKRARRPEDRKHHETAVEAVVANLAYEVVRPSETGHMAVLTGNGPNGFTRYDNRALGKPLRKLLGHFSVLNLIEWTRPKSLGEAFAFAPTEAFAEMVNRAGIVAADFGRLDGQEVIVLSEKATIGSGSAAFTLKGLVDYPETPQTTAMRGKVRALNAFLADADITFVPDGGEVVDTRARTMRRHFSMPKGLPNAAPSFDRCGRLFGGFWQNMKSSRRAGIRIEGESIVNLDYGQMGARLAYAHVGATPPKGDIYAVPGLEAHRDAVKRALNCLLTDDYQRRRWPKEWSEEEEEAGAEARLPAGWTVAQTRGAILIRHPSLRQCMGVGLGMRTMYRESEIMVAVLGEMMSRDIVGLGLHDGLLVQASRAEETKAIMVDAAWSIASTDIPVGVSGGPL